MSRYQYLPLTPQEAYLLSRVDGILDVDSLLKIAGTSRAATAKILYALVSCGIVEWKQDGAGGPPSGRGGFHGLERRGRRRSPRDRSPGHAELVKNTYRRIDWLTHYELLGVAARGAAGEDLRGLLRAQPALPSGPAPPRGPGALREGARPRSSSA